MADEKTVVPGDAPITQPATGTENKSRIDRLVAAANAAVASANPLDLAAIAQDLGSEVTEGEAAIMLGMVQGAITEGQARQMLQITEQQQATKAVEAVSVPTDQSVAAAAVAAGVTVTAPDNPENIAKIVPDAAVVAGAAAVATAEAKPADAVLARLGIEPDKKGGRAVA